MPLYVRLVWFTGPPQQVRDALPDHGGQLRELAAEGRLRSSGVFPDGSGLLEIFEARDRLEAERTARASPIVEQGLGSWICKEWRESDPGSTDFPGFDSPEPSGDEK